MPTNTEKHLITYKTALIALTAATLLIVCVMTIVPLVHDFAAIMNLVDTYNQH